MQLSASVMHCLSFWSVLIPVLNSRACGEGFCVLAGQHMACLCLDTSYKQGLMSLLVHSGPSQDLSTAFTLQIYFEVSTVWMMEKLNSYQLLSRTNGLLKVVDSYFPQFDPWHSSLSRWNLRENDPAVCENPPCVTRGLRSLGYASSHPHVTLQQACANKSHTCLDKNGPMKFETASQHTKIFGFWITGQNVGKPFTLPGNI